MYEGLLEKYTVVIDMPRPEASPVPGEGGESETAGSP